MPCLRRACPWPSSRCAIRMLQQDLAAAASEAVVPWRRFCSLARWGTSALSRPCSRSGWPLTRAAGSPGSCARCDPGTRAMQVCKHGGGRCVACVPRTCARDTMCTHMLMRVLGYQHLVCTWTHHCSWQQGRKAVLRHTTAHQPSDRAISLHSSTTDGASGRACTLTQMCARVCARVRACASTRVVVVVWFMSVGMDARRTHAGMLNMHARTRIITQMYSHRLSALRTRLSSCYQR